MDTYFFDNIDGITGAVICPSTINGISKGISLYSSRFSCPSILLHLFIIYYLLFAGPFKKHSIQYIALAKAAKKRRQAGFVGPYTDAVWPDVHIDDLADLYILVLEGLLHNSIPHGREGGWYV
jgi:hypothetical protein